MATFKISFGTAAGELHDPKLVKTEEGLGEGLETDAFLEALGEMLGSCPLYDGDVITISVVEA